MKLADLCLIGLVGISTCALGDVPPQPLKVSFRRPAAAREMLKLRSQGVELPENANYITLKFQETDLGDRGGEKWWQPYYMMGPTAHRLTPLSQKQVEALRRHEEKHAVLYLTDRGTWVQGLTDNITVRRLLNGEDELYLSLIINEVASFTVSEEGDLTRVWQREIIRLTPDEVAKRVFPIPKFDFSSGANLPVAHVVYPGREPEAFVILQFDGSDPQTEHGPQALGMYAYVFPFYEWQKQTAYLSLYRIPMSILQFGVRKSREEILEDARPMTEQLTEQLSNYLLTAIPITKPFNQIRELVAKNCVLRVLR